MDLNDFRNEIRELNEETDRIHADIIERRDAWIASVWPKYKLGHYSLGEWKCSESPIGVCIYDNEEDYLHDFCVFCDEPEERK